MINLNLPDSSRIWVYQSNRFFSNDEISFVQNKLNGFIQGWNNHGKNLTADARVLSPSFIILAVNESDLNASGCSIDSSVRFVKQIGEELNIDFFDRLKVLIEKDEEFKYVSIHTLTDYKDCKTFNTLVQTIGEFKNSFKIPVNQSPLFQI